MKNSLSVNKQQLSREINYFAKKVIDCDYSYDMLKQEIETKFYNIPNTERDVLYAVIIEKSYKYVWMVEDRTVPVRAGGSMNGVTADENILLYSDAAKNCLAIKLMRLLVEAIGARSFALTGDNCFGSDFYDYCLSRIEKSDILKQVDDADLLIIFLKQAAILLKNTFLFRNRNGVARIESDGVSLQDLYLEAFNAFWEKVKWDDIFPSNPAASRDLMKCKYILLDVMLNSAEGADLNAIANEFFRLTGFAAENDMYMISFLDFYFFTWMEHFGILRYVRRRRNDPVSVRLTEHGRRFLQNLRTGALVG